MLFFRHLPTFLVMASPSVFISYSSADKAIALRVCVLFEKRGVSCWIAPRNVPPGMDYGEAIMDGIKNSRVVLVLLSAESGNSRYVAREVERAVSYQVTVLPVRLEPMDLPERLEFFIGASQWFDVFPNPTDTRLHELGDAVERLIDPPGAEERQTTRPTPSAQPHPKKRAWLWITGVSLAVIALAFAALWKWNQAHSEPIAKTLGQGGNITLVAPKNHAICLGTTLLEWSKANLNLASLTGFEVEITAQDTPPLIERLGVRYSYSLKQTSGPASWRVRPIFKKTGPGEWSESWSFTRDRDVLSRILRTKELHLGHAESGNSFVNGESENLSGFDVDLAKELVERILKKHDPDATLRLVPHAFSWSEEDNDGDGKPEKFPNRLRRESAVDFLASGISITEQRKSEGLAFSNPYLTCPQTLITLKGSPTFVEGKPAFKRIGVVGGTTNAILAQQIKEVAQHLDVVLFEGTGAHEKMLAALFETREIDACMADKSLAINKIDNFQGGGAMAEFDAQDIREIAGKLIAPENIGFVVRPGDTTLRNELNREITASAEFRRELVKKYLPMLNPETEVP